MNTKGGKPETNQTQCRNILIHGYCKFADKGCAFRHDNIGNASSTSTSTSPTRPPEAILKKKQLNADSPSFTPSFINPLANVSISSPSRQPSSTSSSPKVDVVPFYPKSMGNGMGKFNPESTSFNPELMFRNGGTGNAVTSGGSNSGVPMQNSNSNFIMGSPGSQNQNIGYQLQQTADNFNGLVLDGNNGISGMGSPGMGGHGPGVSSVPTDSGLLISSQPPPLSQHQPPPGGLPPPPPPPGSLPPPPPPHHHFQTPISGNPEMYFQPHSAFPLQYHLYAPIHMTKGGRDHTTPHERKVEDFFVNNELREELQKKNEAVLQSLPNSSLPELVHIYHSLVPLDTNIDKNTRLFGYPTWAYKAISNRDGKVYCLRRIEGFRLTNEKAIKLVKKWQGINSTNIVRLNEAFTTRAFGDNSLVFVYDYYPLATTLYDNYFGPLVKFKSPLEQTKAIPEDVIWSYIIQLVNLLKLIHSNDLAARIVDPTRILIVKKNRIRLNCCGIFDILQFESAKGVIDDEEIKLLQQEDFMNIGRLILVLCSKSTAIINQSISKSLEIISRSYSKDLITFLEHLLIPKEPFEPITISSLTALLADKTLDYLSSSFAENDNLESQLAQELENGRLVRLLCKFGFINERPEYDHDPNWSESGDRYLIKLFRDYIFHQVDDLGKPILDLNHVLSTLNKLDAGIEEPILLVSRDEHSCLVVTYKELKSCLISAFRELQK